jgi:hypothetical protein
MSSALTVAVIAAGLFSLALGIVHLWVPRFFALDRAIGTDGPSGSELGSIGLGTWTYRRRRTDAIGIVWVMSNAASYVLLSVGFLDLAWAAGQRAVPLGIGGLWIAGWWILRAGGQFAVGRRRGDVAIASLFVVLAVLHVALATGA